MKKSKPLVDDDGEVRELLVEDLRKFRPLPEVATTTLAEKLDIATSRTPTPDEAGLLSGTETEGKPDRKERMKDAGVKAASTRKARQSRRQSAD